MYRIVHNEHTASYRVEKRGIFGWAFVDAPRGGDYLQFATLEEARAWVSARQVARGDHARRWKVIPDCHT